MVHLPTLQIYHREIPFFTVANKQAPQHRLAMAISVAISVVVPVIVPMIVVRPMPRKLDRIDTFGKSDYLGFTLAGVVQ